MATVDGLTKDRMLAIEAASVVDGDVVGDNLVLTRHDGSTIQAGSVRGPKGDPGTNGVNMTAGARWGNSNSYVVNNTVGYGGRLYTCIQPNVDKCPPFYNDYWTPVTGASSEVWPLVDPFFSAEDLDAYEMFWRSGTVAASLTQTAGEFETGYQAMKLVLAASSSQRFYERGEVVVRGNEVITVSIRAKIVGAAAVAPVISVGLFQSDKNGSPQPFGSGAAEAGGSPLYGTLGTNWATFTFTVQAALAKPRARLNVLVQQGAGNGSTVVIDRIEVSRVQTKLDLKADKTYVDSSVSLNRFAAKTQRLLSGGGVRKVSSTGISWSQRFIIMGLGQGGGDFTQGYSQFTMPPDGTVIPVYGHPTVASVTVASGTIPMSAWYALYYELPQNSSASVDNSRFRIVYYTAAMSAVPANWILVAVCNSDTLSGSYMWGDGRVQDYWKDLTLTSSWVRYNTSFPAPAWRLESDGRVALRGLMKSGLTGANNLFATLPYPELGPDGVAPTSGMIAIGIASAGAYSARIDIFPDGGMAVVALGTTATNAYVSLDNLSWHPGGS